jgi:RNA polymerase-binding transcription factor DksA
MDKLQTTQIRDRLLQRRADLANRRGAATRDARHEAEPLQADFEEQAVQRENDDVLGSIAESASIGLAQVDAALRRLEENRYGVCEVCGAAIAPARLQALPEATCCAGCAA